MPRRILVVVPDRSAQYYRVLLASTGGAKRLFVVPKASGWKNCSKAECTYIYSDRLDATHNLVLPRTATPASRMSRLQRRQEAQGRGGARAMPHATHLELFPRALHAD